MFPIIQPGGRVLGFSGRVLPRFAESDDGQKAPKYVNSPESVLYKKSKTLFGLHTAGSAMRERERGILVEGQIDVVSMHQRGYTETVAPLGTALTKPQCELLARFTDRIVLCFDGDKAGAKAAYAAMPLLLEAGMDVRIAAMPEGEDPDSVSPEVLANLLRAPGSGLEWLMKRMVAKGARQSIEAQARALRALVPLLRSVRGRDARGDYCHLAAELLGVPARRVWSAVGADAGGAQENPRPRTVGPGSGRSPMHASDDDVPPWLSPPPELMDGPPHFTPPGRGAVSAGPSQFSAGMPHSAPMRAVQPLPSGQASLTALLVDRPELARVAEREGVLDRVTDQRLRPIVARVIRAALQGDGIPSEGELLELVDPSVHRLLHDKVFHHEFIEDEDPQAVLDQGLALCERERLEQEMQDLDRSIVEARARGDEDTVRELTVKRMTARQHREQLKQQPRRRS